MKSGQIPFGPRFEETLGPRLLVKHGSTHIPNIELEASQGVFTGWSAVENSLSLRRGSPPDFWFSGGSFPPARSCPSSGRKLSPFFSGRRQLDPAPLRCFWSSNNYVSGGGFQLFPDAKVDTPWTKGIPCGRGACWGHSGSQRGGQRGGFSGSI